MTDSKELFEETLQKLRQKQATRIKEKPKRKLLNTKIDNKPIERPIEEIQDYLGKEYRKPTSLIFMTYDIKYLKTMYHLYKIMLEITRCKTQCLADKEFKYNLPKHQVILSCVKCYYGIKYRNDFCDGMLDILRQMGYEVW